MLKRIIQSWERRLAAKDTNRVVRPFEWGVEFLPRELMRRPVPEDPREVLFSFNDIAVTASDTFYGMEEAPPYEFDGKWLSYPSPVTTPYPENNTAWCRYFPAGEVLPKGGEVLRAKGRAVLVLPQWNAGLDSHVALCRLLNRIGIASLRLSLPYHDRRMLKGFERADFMVGSNIGRTLQACRQAVLDSRAAILWLSRRGYDRIGIIGTSIGSCIAFLTFVHEEKLLAGVYNHVSSYFGDVVWEGITTRHVRRALETMLDRRTARRVWAAISPNSFVKKLASNPRRGFLISALYDLTFPPELSKLLFDECSRHEIGYRKALLPWGHYTMGQMPFKYYDGFLIADYFRKNL